MLNKKNLSIYNFLTGGKVFGLAQEVRSVTHHTGVNEMTELGWYFQQWFDVVENGGGHASIASWSWPIGIALDHVEERLEALSINMAPLATASASSTYCTSAGANCYSASRVNDRDLDSRLGGLYSWANSSTTLPQWVKLAWPNPIRTSRVEVITSDGYPLRNFSVQALTSSGWVTVATVNSNERLRAVATFTEIQAKEIRILANYCLLLCPSKLFLII